MMGSTHQDGTAGLSGGIDRPAGTGSALNLAVIDRDSGFIQVLAKRLDRIGFQHRVMPNQVSPEMLAAMRLSAVVVDLRVYGADAWDWLERACDALPSLGMVVCTGTATVAQRVRGLRLGADDWIAKPCHPEEVIARVESVMRRRGNAGGKARRQASTAGELEVRPESFQAYVRGRSLDLTRREFELIELLAASPDMVFEREEIYSRLWGYVMVRGDRSVDVFVRKLRQKLKQASPGWRYIHTHFGVGYRFAAEPLANFDASADVQQRRAGEGELPASLATGRAMDATEQAMGQLLAGDLIAAPEEMAALGAALSFD